LCRSFSETLFRKRSVQGTGVHKYPEAAVARASVARASVQKRLATKESGSSFKWEAELSAIIPFDSFGFFLLCLCRGESQFVCIAWWRVERASMQTESAISGIAGKEFYLLSCVVLGVQVAKTPLAPGRVTVRLHRMVEGGGVFDANEL